MEFATIIVALTIALIALLLKFIAAPIKRMMTRDIKIVFKTGETFTLPVTPDTPEYQVAQKINDVVDEVMFKKPLIASINIQAHDGKTRIFENYLEKYLSSLYITSESSLSEKTIPKHVETRPFGKCRNMEHKRRAFSEHRAGLYATPKRNGNARDRFRNAEWTKKHDEEFSSAAGGIR